MHKLEKIFLEMEEAMEKEAIKITERFVTKLHSDIVQKTPIDKEDLKNSINQFGVHKKSKIDFQISNMDHTDDYAGIIMISGRHAQGNKMYGSMQLPEGILPFVKSEIKKAEKGGSL